MWELSTSGKALLKPPSDGKNEPLWHSGQERNELWTITYGDSIAAVGGRRERQNKAKETTYFQSLHGITVIKPLSPIKVPASGAEIFTLWVQLIIYTCFDQQRKISSDCFVQINDLPPNPRPVLRRIFSPVGRMLRTSLTHWTHSCPYHSPTGWFTPGCQEITLLLSLQCLGFYLLGFNCLLR